MKIGNTDFNEKAVKKMSFKEFSTSYSKLLRGVKVGDAYFKLTGKKPRKWKD